MTALASPPANWQRYEHRSRPDAATLGEQPAADAAEEIAAYALIRAWMADDAGEGMLMLKEHHVPPEAALFVMSLVKAASRALLSAEG